MARLAALSFQGTCDPTYKRYFEEDEGASSFVKRVFETIANIPDNSVIDGSSAQQILGSDAVTGLTPKFAGLVITLDEPPWMPAEKKGYCRQQQPFGAVNLNPWSATQNTVVLCPGVLTFPEIWEILYPPATKLDEQGNPKPGWGCSGLLDRDTEFMLTPGAYLLHELMHWAVLLQDIPGWNQYIQPAKGPSAQGRLLVGDFKGPNPPSGYGAYYSQLLKKLAVSNPSDFGPYPTLNNADNYMWYAVSKHWSWACQKTFQEAQSLGDDDLRRREGGVILASNPGLKAGDQGSDQPLPGSSDVQGEGNPP